METIKREIYKTCGFRATKNRYNQIVQKSPPEGARFITDGGYIT